MTEDNIRYYWFAAMLEQDSTLENYTMEYPYCTDLFTQSINKGRHAKKELDLLYINKDECFCMEIKFHRNPDLGSTYAKPDAAGSLYNDLYRLSIFRPGVAHGGKDDNGNTLNPISLPKRIRRLFLYVTDDEMHSYFMDPSYSQKKYLDYRAKLKEFYVLDQMQGVHISFDCEVPATFEICALDSLKAEYNLLNTPIMRLLFSTKEYEKKIKSPSFRNGKCHVRLYEIEEWHMKQN